MRKEIEVRMDAVQTIDLDYAVRPRVRYGWGAPSHPQLSRIIAANVQHYKNITTSFQQYFAHLKELTSEERTPHDPFWLNAWFPAWDGIALYCFLANQKPNRFVEIGSGNSTKFARRAIRDHNLGTDIISIDPSPRAAINDICSRIIRAPLEEVDVEFFATLTPQDMLFFDGSHRSLQNSDVTVFFTEVMPVLPRGLLLGIHDIFLPDDYPQDWLSRFYNEQYLLACWLLASDHIRIELPIYYASQLPEIHSLLSPLWVHPQLQGQTILVADSGLGRRNPRAALNSREIRGGVFFTCCGPASSRVGLGSDHTTMYP